MGHRLAQKAVARHPWRGLAARLLLLVAAEALKGRVAGLAVPLIGRELRAKEREQFDLGRVAEGAGDGAFIATAVRSAGHPFRARLRTLLSSTHHTDRR